MELFNFIKKKQINSKEKKKIGKWKLSCSKFVVNFNIL